MAFILRNYQQDAVNATLRHFRQTNEAAVIVLPTGAGKSLVIAELARLAKGKILVLAHVKELVLQNYQKYQSYGLNAGIYSAGLKRKENNQQVTFASIQSVSRNLDHFTQAYSLLIIDECHRVALNEDNKNKTQYHQLIYQLSTNNSQLKVLGLTATPYRMGLGWIYQKHYHGFARSIEPTPFIHCIYELPLRYMIKSGFLTPPDLVDATIKHYDFSSLTMNNTDSYNAKEVNDLLGHYPRVTQGIVSQIIELAKNRQGVMIFAATVEHAKEIYGYLKPGSAALITGDLPSSERDNLIHLFKQRQLKYLVNVSVLTTGFDAPHVDFIAILRPTQSISLYQQIVGRGLRLSENKKDCLVIDYAGNGFDLFYPEVGFAKSKSDSVPVMVKCPHCNFGNTFWGKLDDSGELLEHYGRRCWGLDKEGEICEYRFRFKECPHCNAENDIAARNCCKCHKAIIDPDDQLKNALKLKDALVLRCAGMVLSEERQRLKITYHDEDGLSVSELFHFTNTGQRLIFNQQFSRRLANGTKNIEFNKVSAVLEQASQFVHPDFVIARKKSGKSKTILWQIKEKIFDYQGRHRKANEM